MGEFLSWFWGLPMAVLLAGAGLYLSIRCGFIQLRHFPEAMRHVLGGALRRDAQSADGITPMQALCAALAGTVGPETSLEWRLLYLWADPARCSGSG